MLILNETNNHNPPFKLNGRSLTISALKLYSVRLYPRYLQECAILICVLACGQWCPTRLEYMSNTMDVLLEAGAV